MNNCPLPEDPERMIFCSVSWAQTARNWTFWDCELKEIAPPLSCFCQVFWSLQHKSNSRSGMYKFHDESAASSLAFIPTQAECKMHRSQRLLFKPAIDLCHLPSATKQTTSNRLAWKNLRILLYYFLWYLGLTRTICLGVCSMWHWQTVVTGAEGHTLSLGSWQGWQPRLWTELELKTMPPWPYSSVLFYGSRYPSLMVRVL